MGVVLEFVRKEKVHPGFSAEAYFEKARESESNGMTDVAISLYKRALRKDPKHLGSLLNLGAIYFFQRNFVEAEKYFREAIRADKGCAMAYFNLGNLLEELGKENPVKKDLAEEYYKEAIRIGNYPDAHFNLALLMKEGGRIMEAIGNFQMFLNLVRPSFPGVSDARRELEKLKAQVVVK